MLKKKEKIKKHFPKRYQDILLIMKKIESKNMIANDIRISQKLENKCLLSIEKDILKCKKNNCKIAQKVYNF